MREGETNYKIDCPLCNAELEIETIQHKGVKCICPACGGLAHFGYDEIYEAGMDNEVDIWYAETNLCKSHSDSYILVDAILWSESSNNLLR